jgi:hypothetical protein
LGGGAGVVEVVAAMTVNFPRDTFGGPTNLPIQYGRVGSSSSAAQIVNAEEWKRTFPTGDGNEYNLAAVRCRGGRLQLRVLGGGGIARLLNDTRRTMSAVPSLHWFLTFYEGQPSSG